MCGGSETGVVAAQQVKALKQMSVLAHPGQEPGKGLGQRVRLQDAPVRRREDIRQEWPQNGGGHMSLVAEVDVEGRL